MDNSKYFKFKNKYLNLKNKIGGSEMEIDSSESDNQLTLITIESYNDFNVESSSLPIRLTTIIFLNNTKENLSLPRNFSNKLINMADKTTHCDFWDDYTEGEDIFLEPNEYFIFIICGNNLLGYMNFSFNPDLRINNYEIDRKHYMGLYINTICSFSKNDENNELFKKIKQSNPTFNIGKFLWYKFTEYLSGFKQEIKNKFRTSYDWNYFVYDHTTAEAESYHKSNGMLDITPDFDLVIKASKNRGKNMYELYNFTEDGGNLYIIL